MNSTQETIIVVIADDEEQYRTQASEVVKQCGFIAKVACNGSEALKLCNEGFDLLLTDLDMPILNGFDLCLALKKEGSTKPVVVLSSHNVNQNLYFLRHFGVVDAIVKPYRSEALSEKIKSLFPSSLDSES